MKFLCKIMVVVAVLVSAPIGVLAQSSDSWKERPVTLRVSNQPLGKVLEMVAKAADARITL